MKHIQLKSRQKTPVTAQEDIVCGWLFIPTNTKCVDADSPLAAILKRVPVE